MIDVDHFKAYNDQYGHQVGDECLRSLAGILRDSIKRRGDIIARYGGEEFVAILPRTTEEAAAQLAKSLLETLANTCIQHARSAYGYVTLSVGVASCSQSGMSAEAFLKRADSALYEAKRRGRNQISVAAIWSMPNRNLSDSSTGQA